MHTPYEALFGGKPCVGLASMILCELEDGVSAEEQLLEVLGDKNKEEENAEEVQATLVECLVTLDRANTKHHAEETDSCLPCKRRFKCADDLMDHIKWHIT